MEYYKKRRGYQVDVGVVEQRTKENGVKVYRTDTDGEISILWIKMYKFHYFVNTRKQWR